MYVTFLFFWMPQNTFHRLFYLPPLILLAVARCAPRLSPRWQWTLPALIFLWNFTFLIYPQSRVESNPALEFALHQHDRWPQATPIVYHRFHPDLWTISYFNQQAAWIALDGIDWRQLEHDLDYAHQMKSDLWMEATAHDLLQSDPAGRAWLRTHEQPQRMVVFKDAKHEFRFHCLR